MKRYALLYLYPCGWGSGNKVIAEYACFHSDEAVKHFQTCYPSLELDSNGYAKVGEMTYCIAQFHC
jgi:hypothetical protein